MTGEDIIKLGSIIEKDIQSLFKVIETKEDYQMLNSDLNSIKNNRFKFNFDFEYFKEIVNEEVYDLKNADKILDERTDLFKKVFINPFGEFTSISFHTYFTGTTTTRENPIRDFFYKALFFLFCKAVLLEFDYIIVLKELFEEWKKCRKSNEIQIEIIVP